MTSPERIAAEVPADQVVPMAEYLAGVLAAFPGEVSVSAEAMALVLAELRIRVHREGLEERFFVPPCTGNVGSLVPEGRPDRPRGTTAPLRGFCGR